MLRPLPFVAVRQQQGQTRDPTPFGFARGNELIDHHLRAIGEVTELAFPDHERVRLGRGITVFEGHHSFFGQQGIDDREVALRGADVLQRDVTARIPGLTVLIVQHRMPVTEGAPAGILTRQTHPVAAGDQAGVSK